MKNLAFIQEKFITALFYALEVAQKMKVRVATLPDLIKIRVNTAEDSMAWNRWITPFSTLYLGSYKGARMIVVAHHLGPLSNEKRILEWAKSGTKRKGDSREDYGQAGLPKITKQEFSDLVEGKHGEVAVIDFDTYYHRFLPHISGSHITTKKAFADPLLRALLGPEMEKFIEKHFQISQAYALSEKKDKDTENKILTLKIPDRYGWNLFSDSHYSFPNYQPIGLFLTLGCPSRWGNHDLSVSTEIRTHEDLNYGRFVVLSDVLCDIEDITFNPGIHWKKCLIKSEEVVPDFFVLSKKDGEFFTQYPKDGNCMDTDEIMFEVRNLEKVGEPTFFETPTYGSPFLKYHIDEVKAIAPAKANAYMICGDINPGEIVRVPVQFFKVKIDTRHRILRGKEVNSDLLLLSQINNVAIQQVA